MEKSKKPALLSLNFGGIAIIGILASIVLAVFSNTRRKPETPRGNLTCASSKEW